MSAPTCICGHGISEHACNGATWPHPLKWGVCLSTGCGCSDFRDVKTAAALHGSREDRAAARRADARAASAEAVAAWPWKLATQRDDEAA